MGYNHNGYSLQTFSDNDYNLKTYSGSHSSGYGDDHYGSFSSGGDCCPLVVDPLTFAALLGFIALATYFFNEQIAMSMLARSFSSQNDWIFQGRQ